jgi:hypothetical protein
LDANDDFWGRFLSGGGTRPDALTGLNPEFRGAIAAMLQDMPAELQGGALITSAYRSPEIQAQLFQSAIARYGSEAAARRWVAPPGQSNHGHGLAVDMSWQNDASREWFHANAGNYGLHFPMDWENWHIEPMDASGGRVQRPPNGGAPSFSDALTGALGGDMALGADADVDLERDALIAAMTGGGRPAPQDAYASAPVAPQGPSNADRAAMFNNEATGLGGILSEMQMAEAALQTKLRPQRVL